MEIINDVYDGVDYNGVNPALVTVNTTQHGDTFDWDWNDGSPNDAHDLRDYDFTGVATEHVLVMTATGTPDITTQTDTDSFTSKRNQHRWT